MVSVTAFTPLEKGRIRVGFDNGAELILYRGEAGRAGLKPGGSISEEDYRRLLDEVVGKRAKRRALHLLERMDRTEQELRGKLSASYPPECVDAAVEYVRGFHYLDDYRYACGYIYNRKNRCSKRQLSYQLAQKGVESDVVGRALLEEYTEDEAQQISALLEKRRFLPDCDEKEFVRTYRYLMRRGFESGTVLRIMRDFALSDGG